MSEHAITSVVSVLIAITGVAVIALLVSRSANTSQVLSAGSGAFSSALCTALSPVAGGALGGILGSVTGCKNLTEDVHSTITF